MRCPNASLVQQAARLVCGTTAAAISPAEAQRILTDARVAPVADAHAGGAHPADALSGSSASLLPSLPMLLGHLLAALAAGWLLRRGDLALARLVELSAQSAHSMAEAAFVRALRAALRLVRALHTGLAAAPGDGPAPGALRPVRAAATAHRRAPAHGDQARPAERRVRPRRLTRRDHRHRSPPRAAARRGLHLAGRAPTGLRPSAGARRGRRRAAHTRVRASSRGPTSVTASVAVAHSKRSTRP
ncbi:hypothetical protein SALBM217S_02466 [Streptomyces griseoloalbus]